MNPMDFTGATVMVTGASSGIGRETAILLSALKARVVLTARRRERLEQTLGALTGGGHRIAEFDLSQAEEIPGWLQSVVAETGPLSGLVHAAGQQLMLPLKFATVKPAEALFRTNVYTAIMLARGFSREGCHARSSSIVLLSSVMGFLGSASMSIYGASKAALIGLAKSLAVELAPGGVRVNCVAAACVKTEMLDQMRASFSPERFEALEKAHPLGFGTARDVANAAAFLLADTGRWITGATLVVDGGYSAQ